MDFWVYRSMIEFIGTGGELLYCFLRPLSWMYNFGLQGFRLEELQVFRGFLLGVQAWVKAGGVVSKGWSCCRHYYIVLQSFSRIFLSGETRMTLRTWQIPLFRKRAASQLHPQSLEGFGLSQLVA